MSRPFMFVDSIEAIREYSRERKNSYKAIVEGVQNFSIDEGIFVINTRKRTFAGVAFPYEIHITKAGTVVFFTLANIDITEKLASKIFALAMLTATDEVSHTMPKSRSYADSAKADTRTSTMDPAMTMGLGMDRSVDDIAEAQQRKGGRGYGIADILESMGDF